MTKNNLAINLRKLIGSDEIKTKYRQRLKKGNLTRDENAESHFCVFFAAYDPKTKEVFVGHHKKSDLWLFNGGHIDKGESINEAVKREIGEEWGEGLIFEDESLTAPRLITIEEIDNLKQTCKEHLDIWFFVKVDKKTFKPQQALLDKEFYQTMWCSIDEAKLLNTSNEMLVAFDYLEKN